MTYGNTANTAIDYIVGTITSADDWETSEDWRDTIGEIVGDYVDTNLSTGDHLEICNDLGEKYSRAVDTGTLHKWPDVRAGARVDLSSELDKFASSLACALLEAAALAKIQG